MKSFKSGQKLFTVGYNRHCQLVVTGVKFKSYLTTPEQLERPDGGVTVFDCIVTAGKLSLKSDSSELYQSKSEVKLS